MSRARLVAHALRTARPRQIAGRATRPLRRRRFPAAIGASWRPLPELAALWRSDAFVHADRVVGDGTVDVLGATVPYPPTDWSLSGESRLRRFHLHYGEEALAFARRGDEAASRLALETWAANNPPRVGDAWHPYVVSQRLGNWIAAATLAPGAATNALAASALQQARYLARNVEDEVLGNHVIANARALVLAGRTFEDHALTDQGLALLRREVPQQVLADGGHYERSPLYHLLVLRDLLETRIALDAGWLDEPIARMQRFAAALQRPDGLPAPFNDAPLELAPALELPAPDAGTTVFEHSGYTVVRDDELWVVFDCGPPAPDYLPPHAHADVLSFQLWQRGTAVVIDPGTSTYAPGSVRDEERSTRAHSTVTVDGRNQFELWGAFRSGPLPRVRRLGALEGEVAYGGVTHRRRIEVGKTIDVADEVLGGREVVARLPLAERVDVGGDGFEGGHVAVALYERQETSVAVRRGRSGVFRIPRTATL